MANRDFSEHWKRRLVPFWNVGHWFVRRCGEYLGAVRHGRFGRCDVCGRAGPWLYQRRVLPARLEELWGLTLGQAEAFARKESSRCAWCGANLRARRLARVLRELDAAGTAPASIRDWVRLAATRSLRIAEINRIEGLHEALSGLPNFAFSDFDPDAAPGERVRGVRSEDLTGLTYADASFDVVLTSESLEHVPDLDAALAEIRRVLAPGGRHIFTVPVLPGVARTFPRMRRRADGSPERLAPEIRHPGGDVGYPVWTEFGADLPEILGRAGFAVQVVFGPVRDDDVAQVYVARRQE